MNLIGGLGLFWTEKFIVPASASILYADRRPHVRFTPESGQRADISVCPLCAITGLMQRSKANPVLRGLTSPCVCLWPVVAPSIGRSGARRAGTVRPQAGRWPRRRRQQGRGKYKARFARRLRLGSCSSAPARHQAVPRLQWRRPAARQRRARRAAPYRSQRSGSALLRGPVSDQSARETSDSSDSSRKPQIIRRTRRSTKADFESWPVLRTGHAKDWV